MATVKKSNNLIYAAGLTGLLTGSSIAALLMQQSNYSSLVDCLTTTTVTVPATTSTSPVTTTVDTTTTTVADTTTTVTPVTVEGEAWHPASTVRPATPTTVRRTVPTGTVHVPVTTTTVRQTTTSTSTTLAPATTTTTVSVPPTTVSGHDEDDDE